MDNLHLTGARTRPVTRTRTVPVTKNGRTHHVVETYTDHVAEPPRDWDQAFLTGVTTVAGLIGLGCAAWSTTSIGALLATVAPDGVAYTVAGAFDLLWMSCTVLEWLARYEPDQAKGPRIAGFAFLAVAMAALVIEGVKSHGVAAGIFGAVLSAGAKLLWIFIGRRHARRLDPLTQQWVDQELAEAAGQLAVASVQRRLTRSAAQLAAYRAAYPVDDRTTAAEYARDLMPDATDDEIDAALAYAGLAEPVTSLVMSPEQDDHRDDHRHDRQMTTVPAAPPARTAVTLPVTDPSEMTGAQRLAAARRLDNQARKQKPSRPVTIETLQVQLGLSRRDATELRKTITGKGE